MDLSGFYPRAIDTVGSRASIFADFGPEVKIDPIYWVNRLKFENEIGSDGVNIWALAQILG